MINIWDRKKQVYIKKYFALIGLFIFYLLCLIPYIDFLVDDAYISFVYSKNLINGNGLTYNGLLVEGFSNLSWVILLSPFINANLDIIKFARFFSIISGIVSLTLVFNLAQKIVKRNKLSTSLLASCSVAVLSPFLAWTMGGLETILLSSLIMVLIYIEWMEFDVRKILSPFLIFIISLTRPEGIIVFPIWVAYLYIKNNKNLKIVLMEAILVIIPFFIYILLRWYYYGYPLSNTAYLKLSPSISTSIEAAHWLWNFLMLRPIFSLILLSGIIITILNKHFEKGFLLVIGISIGFIAFIVFSGRDWMPHHRFIAPIIPLMSFPIAILIDSIQGKLFQKIVVITLIIGIGFELFMTYSQYLPLSVEFGRYTAGLKQAGIWINENTRDDATIAVVDAGALAYYGNRKTIDILGLNDEHIAHSVDKMDSDYVLYFKPDIIQLHVGFTKNGTIIPPTDTYHNNSIIDHPEFIKYYVPDIDRPSDPFYPYFFIRICD
jgi:arabinofuranosyltransferase